MSVHIDEQTTLQRVKKYFDFIFQRKGFQADFSACELEPRVREAALQIRGDDRPPALMVHGILPRSGTVFATQLLSLHPDLYSFPYDWFELPFLQLSGEILELQEQFLVHYRHNQGKIGRNDFLTLFGSSIVAYLHAATPPEMRLLMKVPSVEYLHYFWTLFPHEQLLLLTRDGRDVVQSTIKTWPQIRFSFACLRWRRAAGMVQRFHQHHQQRKQGYWLARFEDVVRDPEGFICRACERFGLDVGRYPFDQMCQEVNLIRGSSTRKEDGQVVWEVKEKSKDFQPHGYWRRWPRHRKWLFKRLAGQALIDLGYSEDLKW
jgi:protein-tyrosine sulfotransferase